MKAEGGGEEIVVSSTRLM